MTSQGDRMRAAASDLQRVVRQPWTGSIVDQADEVASLLRSGADAVDRVAVISVAV